MTVSYCVLNVIFLAVVILTLCIQKADQDSDGYKRPSQRSFVSDIGRFNRPSQRSVKIGSVDLKDLLSGLFPDDFWLTQL